MWRPRFPEEQSVLYLSFALSAGAAGLAGWGLLATVHPHAVSTGAFKDVTAGISSIVTALAVIVGGSWAYFKFVRGRTYEPRLAVELVGEWRKIGGNDVLHVRIRVSNVGSSYLALNQYGTGLRVSFPAEDQDRDEVVWDMVPLRSNAGDAVPKEAGSERDSLPARTFNVLVEHEWIEPGETVFDDLLLNFNRPPEICKLEVTLIWAPGNKHHDKFDAKDIEVFGRRILAPDEEIVAKVN
jgi:hypothetical protein